MALGWAVAGAALAADDCAGKPGAVNLAVQVSGLRSEAGSVAVTVYADEPRRWLAPGGKLLRQRVKAEIPQTRACFWLPGPGFYAIAVYHDANGDKDFNRSALGMPVEGFGFSNDAPTRYGLPAFETVRFRVRAGRSAVSIKMRYAN
jgi:uncharacterized protein (DUF2141 family)